MFPRLSEFNITDSRLTYPKHFRQNALAGFAFSNFQDIIFSQLTPRASLSQSGSSPTVSFSSVVSSRSQMQMIGINTTRIVAGVQNTKTICWAFVNFIRQNVRRHNRTVRHSHLTVISNSSTPTHFGGARPFPALFLRWITGHVPRKRFFSIHARRSLWSGPGQRIAMSSPAHVMTSAPAMSIAGFLTTINRTHELKYIGIHPLVGHQFSRFDGRPR